MASMSFMSTSSSRALLTGLSISMSSLVFAASPSSCNSRARELLSLDDVEEELSEDDAGGTYHKKLHGKDTAAEKNNNFCGGPRELVRLDWL